MSFMITLICGNVRSLLETAMFDTSSLFILTFETGELSLKFVSVGIITGNIGRVSD